MVGFVLVSVVSFCCIMGALRNPSAPIPHDSLHSWQIVHLALHHTHSCVDVSNNRFKRQDVTECIVPSFRDIPCISYDYSFCLSPNFQRFVCFMFRHIGIWFVSIRQSDIIFSGLHLDVRKFGAMELSSKTMNIFSSQNFQSSIGDRQCFFTTTTGHQDFDRLHILCIL
jgi:hypothetical protein